MFLTRIGVAEVLYMQSSRTVAEIEVDKDPY